MKKIFTLAMMMTIAISANAMSYSEAKNEALFLSDKMAYELNLTNDQYDAVYEINLDYLMSVNGRNDGYGYAWDRRKHEENMAIAYVDGKMLNNEAQAMQMGQEALQEIFSNGNEEEQLTNLFNEQ